MNESDMPRRVSKSYGMNPSKIICFWCKNPTGEIVNHGRLPGDRRAPEFDIKGYDACPKCQAAFDEGLLLIEVVPNRQFPVQPEIMKGQYPTGAFVVISWEAAERVFPTETFRDLAVKKKATVPSNVFRKIQVKE